MLLGITETFAEQAGCVRHTGFLVNLRILRIHHNSKHSVFVLVFFAATMALERFQPIPNMGAMRVLCEATMEIIDKYYAPRAKFVNIFTATANQANKYEADEVIGYILKKFDGSLPYQIHVISSETHKNDPLKNVARFNMILVDDYESFRFVN